MRGTRLPRQLCSGVFCRCASTGHLRETQSLDPCFFFFRGGTATAVKSSRGQGVKTRGARRVEREDLSRLPPSGTTAAPRPFNFHRSLPIVRREKVVRSRR